MIILSIVIGFVIGVFFTLWLFHSEIYHGQKVGYGPNDIHPDYGSCCRHLPSPNFPPPAPPPRKQ